MELKWLMLNKHNRWSHSSRVKCSLCQYVCELVFGVNVFDLDLGVQINSIKQPIKSNSVGSGNMSHCRTSSFYDHLDHCFVVFKDVQHRFLTRRIRVWESTPFRSSIFRGIFFRVRDVDRSPCACFLWFVFPWRTATIRSQKSSAGIPSNLNPASKEMISDSVALCETKVCLLHIQLILNECVASKSAQCSTRSRFWILKISCEIGVLKQSQSALFCIVSHMTILFVFICMMNVRDQRT